MKPNSFPRPIFVRAAGALLPLAAWLLPHSGLADKTRSATADDLNVTSAWVENALPGTADVALWNAASTLANTLGANLTWGGLDISAASGAVSIGGANNLTLDHSTDINTVLNVGANDFIWGAAGVGGNFNIRGNAAGTSSTAQGATFAGSSVVTISSTGTKNWSTDGSANGVTVVNFTGTLRLRGATIPAIGSLSGNWLAFGGGGGAASDPGAAVQTGAFGLDTGDASTCGSFILTHAWSGQFLKLNSLSGSGSIRADWGLSAGTQTRGIELDQAGNTTFSGSLLAHNGSSQRRNITFRKKGAGEIAFTGGLGAAGSTASLNFDLQAGTLSLGNGAQNPTIVNPSLWDATSTFTIASGAMLKFNSAGTAGGGELNWSRALTANPGADGVVRVVSSGTDGSGYTKGTVALSANNSAFDGTVEVQGGRLRAAHTGALGSASSVAVSAGAQLFLDAAGLNYSGSVSLAGDGLVEAAGQLGAVRFAGGATLSGPVTLTGNSRFTALTAGDTGTVSGAIGDGGSGYTLEKTGAGTVTLSGPNTYAGPTLVSAGTLATTTASTGGGNYSVASGARLAVTIATPGQTLSVAALEFGASGAQLTCALGSGNPTAPVVGAGLLTLNGGDVAVNVSGSGLTAGTYELLTYTSRTGSGAFVAGTLPALPPSLAASIVDDVANQRVLLQIELVGLKWAVGDGDWDTVTANWLPLTGGSPTTYTDGVAVTLNDDATGASPITLNLTAPRSPAGVVVNNSAKNYVLTGAALAGTGELTKLGDGSLTVNGDVTTTGTLSQQGAGTMVLNGTVSGAASIVQAGTGTLTVNGPITASAAVSQTAAGLLELRGTNSFSGAPSINAGTLRVFNGQAIPDTATVSIASGATFEVNDGETVAGLNTVAGSTVTAQSGTLQFTSGSLLGTLTGSGTVLRNGTTDTAFGQFTTADALAFNGTLRLRGSTPSTSPAAMQGGTGRFWLHSASGSQLPGTAFALDTGSSATDAQDLIIGDWDATSGNRRLTLSSLTGYGSLRVDAGGAGVRTVIVDQSGGDTEFHGMVLSHTSGAGEVRAIALEKKGTSSLTFAGIVGKQTAAAGAADAPVSITVSDGTLVLAAANTYTGPTTVNAGHLVVSGSLAAASAVAVIGGTLGGTGTINGPVSVNAGGTLAPGTSIGTLTINNTLTLAGTTALEIHKTGMTLTSDLVTGISALNCGGTATVSVTGDALAAGDEFTVFNAATFTGSFSGITPAPGAGLAWDIHKLATQGKLLVHANPVPGAVAASVPRGGTASLGVAKLLGKATGEPGETLSIVGVTSPTPGGGNATLSGGNITYTAPTSGTSDTISYTLSDGRGGLATGTVTVTLTSPDAPSLNVVAPPSLVNNEFKVTFAGIPGLTYTVEDSTVSPAGPWNFLTNLTAGPNGLFQLVVTNDPPAEQRYFRTTSP